MKVSIRPSLKKAIDNNPELEQYVKKCILHLVNNFGAYPIAAKYTYNDEYYIGIGRRDLYDDGELHFVAHLSPVALNKVIDSKIPVFSI